MTTELFARRQAAVPRGAFNTTDLWVESGLGALLRTAEDKELIDFASGIGAVLVGHCHPRLVEAIVAQAGKILHPCWHVSMYETYLELAEALNERMPIQSPVKTVFFNSGAEAVENAFKIARAATGRGVLATFRAGYHGRTSMALAATGLSRPYKAGIGPLPGGIERLDERPFYRPASIPASEVLPVCEAELEHFCRTCAAASDIAALVFEPVLGSGGFCAMHPAAAGLLREFCTYYGIVLLSDEVQAGFGRTGSFFGCEALGIEVDLLVFAKAVAGGLPLSGVSGQAELMDAPIVGALGGTYGGNPVACAAGLAVLEIIDDEGLLERAQLIGERLEAAFEGFIERYQCCIEQRGLGSMRGLVLSSREAGMALRAGAIERGLLTVLAGGTVLRTLPPLVITDEQLERAIEILDQTLEAIDS